MPRSIIGAVVLLLALAGCGGDPKADPPPSPSASVSTPTTSAPTPPVMPAAAQANTKAGAIAFVRYYVEVFNEAQRTGSHAQLAALSKNSCAECTSILRALDKVYGAQGHIEGGELSSGAATAEYNGAEGVWLVLLRVDSGSQTVFESASAIPKTFPGGHRSMEFSVVRLGSSWKVAAWTRA